MIISSAFFIPFFVFHLPPISLSFLSSLDDLIRVLGDDLEGKVDVALLQEAGADSEPAQIKKSTQLNKNPKNSRKTVEHFKFD